MRCPMQYLVNKINKLPEKLDEKEIYQHLMETVKKHNFDNNTRLAYHCMLLTRYRINYETLYDKSTYIDEDDYDPTLDGMPLEFGQGHYNIPFESISNDEFVYLCERKIEELKMQKMKESHHNRHRKYKNYHHYPSRTQQSMAAEYSTIMAFPALKMYLLLENTKDQPTTPELEMVQDAYSFIYRMGDELDKIADGEMSYYAKPQDDKLKTLLECIHDTVQLYSCLDMTEKHDLNTLRFIEPVADEQNFTNSIHPH